MRQIGYLTTDHTFALCPFFPCPRKLPTILFPDTLTLNTMIISTKGFLWLSGFTSSPNESLPWCWIWGKIFHFAASDGKWPFAPLAWLKKGMILVEKRLQQTLNPIKTMCAYGLHTHDFAGKMGGKFTEATMGKFLGKFLECKFDLFILFHHKTVSELND